MDARRVMIRRALAVLLLPFAAQGCGDGADQLPRTDAANAVERAGDAKPLASVNDLAGATPMRERVAVIGLLNKRNGLTRDLKMKPGDALRVGDAIVRLRACEATAPWEEQKETGAFVQLDVRAPRDDKWRRVFSGWLFRERPDRNVVEHPIYDVWVKSCTMRWPETGPATLRAGERSGAKASAEGAPAPAENVAVSSTSDTSESAADNNE